MKSTVFARSIPFALALLLGGCAGYAHRADVNEVPTLRDAYLYGRLYMDAPKAFLGLDGHQTMGFAIECDDKSRYVLRMDREDPIMVVKIRPATCSWTEVVYSDGDGTVRTRKPAPPDLFKHVTLKGGYSYYLGDFDGAVTTSMVGTTVRTRWNLKDAKDNFEATTVAMQSRYPKLKALPVVNRGLAYTDLPSDSTGPDILEEQIRAEYERWIATLDRTEYKASHILVETRDQADAALKRVQAGEPFATVARAVSRDPGSAEQGGDLGWAVPTNYVPPFGEALKRLKPNDMTAAPVKSPFGWHVILVTDMRSVVPPPYERVRERIEAQLRKKVASQTQQTSAK
ncbi:MAG: peptidylprolyl isomerase [Aquabacterium sp.]|uniref:peptidylprolyl isomerase n=1 Tax=Aquabacterium sp. TaxID=1872578 RepID=UPI0025B8AE9F|nr:peptidylprolyl isomerase [Aquabacterium sp.]MBI5927014.1 peptidylprolyl isomerase [Aquabacterium sp.]